MKAMILAAGRGNRLRPLTDDRPKPLIEVGGRPIIGYHLEHLSKAGFKEVVINISHLKDLFIDVLGDGRKFGIKIHYSVEPEGALETGGGIFNALDLLGPDPFLVVSGKVLTNYDFRQLPKKLEGLAHLVLVNHPREPKPDFGLRNGLVVNEAKEMYTFAGIGIYRPEMFMDCESGSFGLGALLRRFADHQQITGEFHRGEWFDLVNVEDLELMRSYVEGAKQS